MAMNSALVHLGYLITRYDQRELAQKECETLLRRTHGRQVLQTMTPASAEFGQANSCRQPVEQYKPKGKAAKAVRAAWEEIIDRASDHFSKRRAG